MQEPQDNQLRLNQQLFDVIRDKEGRYSEKQREQRVQKLIGEGADINARDMMRKTPLIAAAQAERVLEKGEKPLLVEALLAVPGVDINAQDTVGCSALQMTLFSTNKSCRKQFKQILDAGADTSLKNINNDTVLHTAAQYGKRMEIDTLLQRGLPLHVQNQQGRTAFELCVQALRNSVDERGIYSNELENIRTHLPSLETFATHIDARHRSVGGYHQAAGEIMEASKALTSLVAATHNVYDNGFRKQFIEQMGTIERMAEDLKLNPLPVTATMDINGVQQPVDIDVAHMSRFYGRLLKERSAYERAATGKPALIQPDPSHVKKHANAKGDADRKER